VLVPRAAVLPLDPPHAAGDAVLARLPRRNGGWASIDAQSVFVYGFGITR